MLGCSELEMRRQKSVLTYGSLTTAEKGKHFWSFKGDLGTPDSDLLVCGTWRLWFAEE